jgi:hypothetical protein
MTGRNLFDDQRIKELSDQAKAIISGVNPSQLKYNLGLKNKIQKEMETLKTAIDESIIDLPRRKLRLAA